MNDTQVSFPCDLMLRVVNQWRPPDFRKFFTIHKIITCQHPLPGILSIFPLLFLDLDTCNPTLPSYANLPVPWIVAAAPTVPRQYDKLSLSLFLSLLPEWATPGIMSAQAGGMGIAG